MKVTDRGPFCAGRVVDLSMAAARELGMVASGVAAVRVEKVGYRGKKPISMIPNAHICFLKLDISTLLLVNIIVCRSGKSVLTNSIRSSWLNSVSRNNRIIAS